MTPPLIRVFFLAQRHFIEGLSNLSGLAGRWAAIGNQVLAVASGESLHQEGVEDG